MNEIGQLIYNRRKELGLTMEEVGNAVGVSKSTVKKWENGLISNMRRDKIEKLAKVLQISPVRLLGIKTVTTVQPSKHDTSQDSQTIPHYTNEQIDAIFKASDQFIEDIEMASVMDIHYIIKYYEMLNITGRQIALRQIKDLTKIPEYQSDDPLGLKDRKAANEQLQAACATIRNALDEIQASSHSDTEEND
jgi:transcriptional regulator with XRE-family HTH domain